MYIPSGYLGIWADSQQWSFLRASAPPVPTSAQARLPRKKPAMHQKARAYTQASRFTQSSFCCLYLLQPIQTESALLPYIQLQPSALPLAWVLSLAWAFPHQHTHRHTRTCQV